MSKNLRIRVQPILKGTWDSSIPYTPMDVVSTDEGSYYWCLKECTGKNPDDDKDKEFWLEVGSDLSLLNQAKKQGQIGDNLRVLPLGTDLNTIIESGNYALAQNLGNFDTHYPQWVGDGCILQVLHDRELVYQRFTNEVGFIFERVSWNLGETWNRWEPIKMYSLYENTNIYISKNGDDSDNGKYPDHPVLTIDRAITLANSLTFIKPNSYITFCFGAGDWGDITFLNLSYLFKIAPYDGVSHTEYSEDLPVFGNLVFANCYAVVRSIVAQKVEAADNSIIYIDTGYKSLGSIISRSNSFLQISGSTAATNVWEIQNNPNANTHIIKVYGFSYVYILQINVKLSQNISGNFFSLFDNGHVHMVNGWIKFISTEFKCTGNKLSADIGTNVFDTAQGPGVLTALDSFPCTGGIVAQGNSLVVNGLSLAATTKTSTSSLINQKLGTSTSLTALANLDESAEDSVETLEIKKQKAIAQINSEVQQAIYSGFPYEIDGKEYLFGTSVFDQLNMLDLIGLSVLNLQDTFSVFCTDMDTGNNVSLSVSASQLQEIFKFIVDTKQSILQDANEKKNEILHSTSEEEIDKIYKS